jgi:hypothetical protein
LRLLDLASSHIPGGSPGGVLLTNVVIVLDIIHRRSYM